jgi:hypothetical protein
MLPDKGVWQHRPRSTRRWRKLLFGPGACSVFDLREQREALIDAFPMEAPRSRPRSSLRPAEFRSKALILPEGEMFVIAGVPGPAAFARD